MIKKNEFQLKRTTTQETQSKYKEPLWRRLQLGAIKQEDQTTQKSSKTGLTKKIEAGENYIRENMFNQPNINEFLLKMHHRISESVYGSQSQIMEKLELDWQEEQSHRGLGGSATRIVSMRDPNNLYYLTARSQKNHPVLAYELGEIKNINQLLTLLIETNPKVFNEISKLMEDKTQLSQECGSMKQKQKINEQKIRKLINQIEKLKKENNEVLNNYEKLKSQVQTLAKGDQEKYKYKYEKITQEMRQDFDRKLLEVLKKAETSTNLTSSGNLNELKEAMVKIELQQGRARAESTKNPVGKKKSLFVRSNNRNSTFERNKDKQFESTSSKVKVANLTDRIVPNVKCKTLPNEYQQIVWQIVKPSATKSLSLLNSNNE